MVKFVITFYDEFCENILIFVSIMWYNIGKLAICQYRIGDN